ncbi:hypothetical protein WG922_03975 [Ramlibacter sp. AN1015]|uniref:hypothetical protein n=1 Tax=Ramlibacter sp. AN1015 TaxID=3133428 RepID=UPI0030C50764
MNESSHRLEQSRLAILEHIQRKQQSPGMLRSAFNKVAHAAGFGSQTHRNGAAEMQPVATQETPSRDPIFEESAAQLRIEEADRKEHEEAIRGTDPATRHARRADRLFGGRFAALGDAGRTYWSNHPANLVVELARPVMSSYAQRRPVSFLAIAMAAGAVFYLAKPWRMISLTGLALAALRSPQVSSALISAMYGPARADEGMSRVDEPDIYTHQQP